MDCFVQLGVFKLKFFCLVRGMSTGYFWFELIFLSSLFIVEIILYCVSKLSNFAAYLDFIQMKYHYSLPLN